MSTRDPWTETPMQSGTSRARLARAEFLPLAIVFVLATAADAAALRGSAIKPAAGVGPPTRAGMDAIRPAHPDAAAEIQSMGADASWWETATAEIARAEYAATWTAAGLQAPNRAQNLRAHFRERGIEVVPREGDEAVAWRFAWETAGFGRAGALRTVEAASPEAQGSRVTYRRPELDEWYENSPEGLEQGFTVHAPPPGEGPLCIVGRLASPLRADLSVEEGAVDLFDEHGARTLRYGDLHVWDAHGDEIPSQLETRRNGACDRHRGRRRVVSAYGRSVDDLARMDGGRQSERGALRLLGGDGRGRERR